jgi:hypothetical protein
MLAVAAGGAALLAFAATRSGGASAFVRMLAAAAMRHALRERL